MKRKLKSLFMGLCASLIMLAIVAFFNSTLKEPLAQLTDQTLNAFISVTPTPAILGETISSQSGELARVKRVVDGDTIELQDGRKVRYIGMDTPESKKPNTPVQCFSQKAADRNAELVVGKEVLLVKDISEKDRFQRLLRYVYVGDIFVNETLIKEGYAFSRSYPPDITKQEQLRRAEELARTTGSGFWSGCSIVPKGSNEYTVGN